MAMFSDYKGKGITPVSGVIEAGANIGKMYQQGLSSMGESIGKGIQRYGEAKKEDEMRTAEAEAEATKTKFLYDSIKDNPKLAPFAKSFEPHFENMGKFGDMDSKKKNAALLSLKAFNSNIGNALTLFKEKGIEEDKTNLLTAQTNASSVGLTAIYDSIKDNPELKPYANKIKEHIVSLEGVKGMSDANKQNALLAAEAFHKTIPTTLPLFERSLATQTSRDMDALKIDAKKFGKEPDIQNITLAIKNGWNPNISPSENVAQASAEVDKFLAANPEIQNTDKEAYMKAWLAHWRMKTSNATPDQMNPDTKARTLKQLDLLAQLPAQEMYSETDSGVEEAYLNAVTDTTTSAVQQKYDALKASQATPPAAETPAPPKEYFTAKQKFEAVHTPAFNGWKKANNALKAADEVVSDLIWSKGDVDKGGKNEQKLKDAKAKRDEIKKQVDSLSSQLDNINLKDFKDDVAPSISTPELAAKEQNIDTRLQNLATKTSIKVEKEQLERYLKEVQSGGYIGIVDRFGSKGSTDITKHPLSNQISYAAGNEQNKILEEAIASQKLDTQGIRRLNGVFADVAKQRESDLSEFIGNLRDKQNASLVGGNVRASDRLVVENLLKQRLEKLKQEEAIPQVPESATPESALATAQEKAGIKSTPVSRTPIEEPVLEPSYDAQGRADTGIALGQRFQPVEITWQEKKEEYKDWFIKTRGQVPMSFDKIFEDRYPESKLKVVKTAIGDMWSDGEKWHLAPAREVKQMSEKEKSELSLYNYGGVNQATGKIEYEERIPDSGILTLGSIKGGEKKAEAFDNLTNDVDKIRTYVPKLLAMFGKLGHSIPKAEHGTAEIMMTELKAAIRVKTVGTGPVALPEHAMIAKQIGDPTAFFAWDMISKQKLETLLATAEASLVKNSAGIKVVLRPAGKSAENQSEQAKLDIKLANRNKQPK